MISTATYEIVQFEKQKSCLTTNINIFRMHTHIYIIPDNTSFPSNMNGQMYHRIKEIW